MTDKFDEFMEEVEGDIRQEKFKELWDKYGKKAGYGVASILAVTASLVLWNNYDNERTNKLSERFISIEENISSGKIKESNALILSSKSSHHDAYHALYQIKLALNFLKGKEKNVEKSKEILKKTYMEKSTPKVFQTISGLYLIMINLNSGNKLSDDESQLLKKLSSEKNPWKPIAMELSGLNNYQMGNIEKSIEIFSEINRTSDIPRGIKVRSKIMSQIALSSIK